MDNLQEQNATLREVTLQQALLDNHVIINAYMPVEEKSATVLFEKMFMQHLATRSVISRSACMPFLMPRL
ncbi:unnamed protein product [Dibothriocephalus latus]|uniref:Uncharacterized protein n=1 Tax=Dibothriocephalus latus TaxID=60516 RepID=A0A3P7R394_DIBLA|nr:unnamed protein product [Dibothriocephalus latus]